MPNDQSLSQIIGEIYLVQNPKIEDSRRASLADFIKTTVNGDEIVSQLIEGAGITKDRRGILVYVLTNLRLIKFEIDDKIVQSSSFPLDTMIGVDRKLAEDGRAAVEVSFQNGSFGLRYAQANQKITDFFTKVDQSRVRK
jgi:hypothetical protein